MLLVQREVPAPVRGAIAEGDACALSDICHDDSVLCNATKRTTHEWARTFNREVMKHADEPLQLPACSASGSGSDSKKHSCSFVMCPSEWSAVENAAVSMSTTTYGLMAGAYSLLLCMYSNQDSLVLPVCISKQRKGQSIVESSLLRASTRNDDTVGEFIARIAQAVSASMRGRMLLRDLQQFICEERGDAQGDMYDLFPAVLTIVCTEECTPVALKASLSCELKHRQESGIHITLRGRGVPPSVLDDMSKNLNRLMRALCNDISRSVTGIMCDILDKKGALRVLAFGRHSDLTGSAQRSAEVGAEVGAEHQLWKHVLQDPKKTMIHHGRRSVSYAQLWVLAQQFSAMFHALDGGTGDGAQRSVVLACSKSIYAIAAIVGAWMASCYVVPVARTRSNAAVATIAARCHAGAVLFDHPPNSDLFDGYMVLSLELLSLEMEVEEQGNAESLLQPPCDASSAERIAYSIFTSGSTGEPKQCVIRHGNLTAMIHAWACDYELDADVCVLQWALLSFDVFMGDLMRGCFSAPGTLVLCDSHARLDVEIVGRMIREYDVTHFETTPQFALLLTDLAGVNSLSSMKMFIVGSDTVTVDQMRKIRASLPPATRLLNSYGLSEATIDSTFSEFQEETATQSLSGTCPIGQPMLGVRAYVLSRNNSLLAPVGAIGELSLAGRAVVPCNGLAIDLDSVPHIRSKLQDERRWGVALCTRDLARWLPSGQLEFLGRPDRVAKLRGMRVNCAEIQRVILKGCMWALNAAVVLMDEAVCSGIAAFVVAGDFDERSVAERVHDVKRAVAVVLPRYCTPSKVFVQREALPITANGKLDHKTLVRRACETDTAPEGIKHIDSDPVMTMVACSWLELQLPQSIGANDVLRDHTDSLSMARFHAMLVRKVKEKYGSTAFGYCDLIRCGTFSRIAQCLRDERAGKNSCNGCV